MTRRARRRGMLHALRRRESGVLSCNAFRRAAYSALVPSSTFIHVQAVPNLYFRRFTACGQYLIALDANNRLTVFRFETGGRRTHAIAANRLSHAHLYDTFAFPPPSSRLGSRLLSQLDDDHLQMPSQPSHAASLLLSLPVPLLPSTPQRSQAHSEARNLPSYACHFAQFFTHMYTMSIASGAAHLARDFSMTTSSGKYLVLASYQTHDQPPQQPSQPNHLPAIASLPSMTIIFYLVEVRTGVIVDRFVLLDDYVKFASHEGVHFYADMLCILSMRHQLLHIVKIQEALGKFTQERCIGAMCDRHDHQVIARAREAQSAFVAQQQERSQSVSNQPAVPHRSQTNERLQDVPDAPPAPPAEEEGDHEPEHSEPKETGLGNGMLKDAFYSGLMQRLLVYVYRRMHSEGNVSLFYRLIGLYSHLVMRKAQFLDEDHLLIRVGSFNGNEHGIQQQSMLARETCFFVVYCMSSTRIINLFENRSTQLLRTFHMYREAFVGDEMEAACLPPLRNSVLDEEDGREEDNNDGGAARRNGTNEQGDWTWSNSASRRGTSERVKRTRLELSRIPVSRQVRMVSPYLDRSLFSYNPERSNVLTARRFAPAKDLGSVKFMSAETGELRFKLATEFSLLDGEAEGERGVAETEDGALRRRMFLFHPLLPFVMAMEGHRPVNFHVYGHAE